MKIFLFVRIGPDILSKIPSPFSTYSEALLAGQEYGHGNFFIDTKDKVPTRETQLGQETDREFVRYKKPIQHKAATENNRSSKPLREPAIVRFSKLTDRD